MTMATKPARAQSTRGIAVFGRINASYVALLSLLIVIACITPSILEPAGLMNFLRRGAPLAVVASGQLFVIVVGGFDLSVGSLITLTVMGSALLINNDPDKTWWVMATMYGIGLLAGLINGLVVTYLKVPSIIATLGALLSIKGVALAWSGGSPQGYLPDNFRQFGRLTLHDVPLLDVLPLAVIVLLVVVAIFTWLLHRTNFGRLALVVGDNAVAAALAGVPVRQIRILAFVLSALSAVTAGILLGGFSGVSTDAGDGFELQSIAAAVLGGAQLLGGRGSVPGVVSGALSLTALFTLLNLLGLPKPLRDAVQGLILIAAAAYSVRRQEWGG
jgi:ribose transport system permease protein